MENSYTIALINKALDAAMLKQTAIAFNLNHVNSLNAGAQRVQFDQQLQAAQSLEAVQTLQPRIESTNAPIRIDQEMAQSMENTTQYRALAKGINKHFALMQIAMRGQG